MFQSYLRCGCLVWGFANKCLINKIFCIQKRAIRLISFSRYKANSSPLFHKLGILKVFDLIAIFRFQFVHDWIHKRLPTAFENMFTIHTTTYVETMTRCHCPFDALANGGIIRYGIKVQPFITV